MQISVSFKRDFDFQGLHEFHWPAPCEGIAEKIGWGTSLHIGWRHTGRCSASCSFFQILEDLAEDTLDVVRESLVFVLQRPVDLPLHVSDAANVFQTGMVELNSCLAELRRPGQALDVPSDRVTHLKTLESIGDCQGLVNADALALRDVSEGRNIHLDSSLPPPSSRTHVPRPWRSLLAPSGRRRRRSMGSKLATARKKV